MLFFVLPRRYHSLTDNYLLPVPISKNTTVFEPYILEESLTRWTFDISWDICFCSYYFVLVIRYIYLSTKEKLLLLWFTIIGYSVFVFSRIYLGSTASLTIVSCLLPYLMVGLGLKLILPKNSGIPRIVVWSYLSILLMLIVYSIFMWTQKFSRDNDFLRLVLICVVFPFFKETVYSVNRATAKSLSLDPNVIGTSVKVDSEVTCGFYLWAQILWSLVIRGLLVNAGNPTLFTIAVIFQNVTEFLIRYSVEVRDQYTEKIYHVLQKFCKGKSSIVASEMAAAKYLDASTIESTKNFYSQFLVCEMIAEYVAMMMVTLLVIIYKDKMLEYPHQYYLINPHPFEEPLDYDSLIQGLLLQFGSELVVDILTLRIETKRGYDISGKMDSLATQVKFHVTLMFSSLFAISAYTSFHSTANSMNKCAGQDICLCGNGGGLDPNGLRQLFCNYTNN